VQSIVIAANRSMTRIKSRLLLGAADLLDQAYYKVWFCRLASKLPLKRRSLRPLWIRTRL
jgi:hypothetical protein